MTTSFPTPLTSIPQRLVFNIIEKMKLVSLCRTRRTCKRLDNFVEENRFSITRGIFENTNLRISVSQDSFSVDACRRRDYEKIINPFTSFSAISFKNIIIQYLDFFDLDNVIEENKIRTKEKVFSLLQTLRLSCEVLQLSNMTEKDFLEFLSISNCKEVRVDFSEGNFDRVLEAIHSKKLFRVSFEQPIYWEDFPVMSLFDYVKDFQGFRMYINSDQIQLAENALCKLVNDAGYLQQFRLEEFCFRWVYDIEMFSIFSDVRLVWCDETDDCPHHQRRHQPQMPKSVYLIRRSKLCILLAIYEDLGRNIVRIIFVKQESLLTDRFLNLFPVFDTKERETLSHFIRNAYIQTK